MSAQWLTDRRDITKPGMWRYSTRGASSEGSWNESRLSPGKAPSGDDPRPPEPKFKIGDWVSGTDDNPSRIKSFQWMEQEGLYRYQVAHHFGEDSWAESQLSSVPAQDISQSPTWGEVPSPGAHFRGQPISADQINTAVERWNAAMPHAPLSDSILKAIELIKKNGGDFADLGGRFTEIFGGIPGRSDIGLAGFPAVDPRGSGKYFQTGDGGVLGEVISTTDAPAKVIGPLDQFLDETRTVGSGGNVMANGDLLGEGPFTRYLRRRGVGTDPGQFGVGQESIGLGSRAGRFISGQFGDIQDLMEQMEVIRAARGGGAGAFGLDQFAPIAGTVGERANLGASALQDLFGMTQTEREDAGLTFENTFIDDERLPSTYGLDWLQNLLRSGTRGSAGRIGSKFLAGRLPYMQQQFDLRRGAPGVATNFIDFFKNRFGL